MNPLFFNMASVNLEVKHTQPGSGKKASQFLISLLWGLILFVALLAGFEIASRLDLVSKVMPFRSVGDYHAQFEIKWFKLEDYVRQNGGVDVIILGNSMVNTGIDPQILANDYAKLTGKKLRIFNFGVEGLTVAPLSDLAQMLETKYHPGTILLFTEIRDYKAGNGDDVAAQFLSAHWMRYELGQKDPVGWLIDHSAALQELLVYRNWSMVDAFDTFLNDNHRFSITTAQGYEPDTTIGRDIDTIPDPNNPVEAESYAMFKDYSMDPSRINDLKKIINLQNQGTKVLVTEFPVYPTYYAYFSSKQVPIQYHQQVAQIVKDAGSLYIPAISSDLIPLNFRVDNHHLNFEGAPLYSKYLAQTLAGLCNTQKDCLQPSTAQRVQP